MPGETRSTIRSARVTDNCYLLDVGTGIRTQKNVLLTSKPFLQCTGSDVNPHAKYIKHLPIVHRGDEQNGHVIDARS